MPVTDVFTPIQPQVPSLVASIGGSASSPGTANAYYVVVANYVGGSVASNIVQVNNVPNTLSSTNLVALQWTNCNGAVTYDVLKLTTAQIPTGSNSIALHTGLTVVVSTDQGSGLSSYTLAAPPANNAINLDLNSRDYLTPQFEFNGIGNKPGLSVNSIPSDASSLYQDNTNATATGVTIPAAQLVNGLFFHSPTGAVNDTTDTATAILAALQSVYVTATEGTAFDFYLFNTSGSAVAITLLAGSGVTVVGTATVAQNAVRIFKGIVTAIGTPAVKLYSLGSGAF